MPVRARLEPPDKHVEERSNSSASEAEERWFESNHAYHNPVC